MHCMRTNDQSQKPCDYHVQLVCPRCFRWGWTLKRRLPLNLEEVLNTAFEFECPEHGKLLEKPLVARAKRQLIPGLEQWF